MWLTEWDRGVFLAFNRIHHPLLDTVAPLVTHLGLGWIQAIVVIAACFVLAFTNRKEERLRLSWAHVASRKIWAYPLLASLAVSGLSADVVKYLYPRSRPWWYWEQEHAAGRQRDIQVRTVEGVYPLKVRGFPSGHTTTAFALAASFSLISSRTRRRRRWVPVVWTMAFAVAWSRIYLASHWPLDVLGGIALGVLSGWGCGWWWWGQRRPAPDGETECVLQQS